MEAFAREYIARSFKGVSSIRDEEIEMFISLSCPFSYEKDEVFLKEGQTERYLRLVTSGIVREFFTVNGKEITMAICLGGDFMTAYASFVNQRPSRTNLVAHSPTKGYHIAYADLQSLYNVSHAGNQIGRYFAEAAMTEYQDRIFSLMGDSPETRYLTLLEKEPELLLHIPQKHIASYLGITPETLSRIRGRIRV